MKSKFVSIVLLICSLYSDTLYSMLQLPSQALRHVAVASKISQVVPYQSPVKDLVIASKSKPLQSKPLQSQSIKADIQSFKNFDNNFQRWLMQESKEIKALIAKNQQLFQQPDQSLELIQFKQSIEQFDTIVKNWLQQQPKDIQKLFEQQVKGYVHYLQQAPSSFAWKQVYNVRLQVVRKYPYVMAALYVAMFATLLVNEYVQETAEREKPDAQLSEMMWEKEGAIPVVDHELLEVFESIIDALGLDPIPLYEKRENQSIFDPYAYYQFQEKLICVFPAFFKESKDVQVNILIHELRHHMQNTQNTIIPEKIVEIAEKYVYKTSVENWNTSEPGLVKLFAHEGRKIAEFDADSFAASKFSCPCCLKNIQKLGWQNRSAGYLAKDDYEPYIEQAQQKCRVHAKSIKSFEKFKKWLNIQSREPSYADYLPSSLKPVKQYDFDGMEISL